MGNIISENKLLDTAIGYIKEDAKHAHRLEDVGNFMTIPVELITPESEAYDPFFTKCFNDFIDKLSKVANDDKTHLDIDIRQPSKEVLIEDFKHANIVVTFVYTGDISNGDLAIKYLSEGLKGD